VPPPLVEPPLVAVPLPPPVPRPPEVLLLSISGELLAPEQPLAAAATSNARVPTKEVLKEWRGSLIMVLPRVLKLVNPEEALRAVRPVRSSPELAR
jgi:hypothetical protein